jgi:hypothetical protein
MRSPLQEKIQVTVVPTPTENGEEWVSFESVRESQANVDTEKLNHMPPGMDICNQCSSEINSMPRSCAGETDVSMDTNPASFSEGYRRRMMRGIDDQYTDEHVDLFYTTVKGEDGEGFAERQNYLDRI